MKAKSKKNDGLVDVKCTGIRYEGDSNPTRLPKTVKVRIGRDMFGVLYDPEDDFSELREYLEDAVEEITGGEVESLKWSVPPEELGL